MPFIKITVTQNDKDRLLQLAGGQTLPSFIIAAINKAHKDDLSIPIEPPKPQGNPNAAEEGRKIAAKRKKKATP